LILLTLRVTFSMITVLHVSVSDASHTSVDLLLAVADNSPVLVHPVGLQMQLIFSFLDRMFTIVLETKPYMYVWIVTAYRPKYRRDVVIST